MSISITTLNFYLIYYTTVQTFGDLFNVQKNIKTVMLCNIIRIQNSVLCPVTAKLNFHQSLL